MAKKQGIIVDHNRIESQVWELAEPLAAACGAVLIDVEYLREAGEWYLRLYIDREDGDAGPVDHDLCERMSRSVDPALDKADIIQQSYYLEVSSPGLERALRREADFIRYQGKPVTVKLYAPRSPEVKSKEFSGSLIGLSDGCVIVENEAGGMSFPQQEVAKVHLIADLD